MRALYTIISGIIISFSIFIMLLSSHEIDFTDPSIISVVIFDLILFLTIVFLQTKMYLKSSSHEKFFRFLLFVNVAFCLISIVYLLLNYTTESIFFILILGALIALN